MLRCDIQEILTFKKYRKFYGAEDDIMNLVFVSVILSLSSIVFSMDYSSIPMRVYSHKDINVSLFSKSQRLLGEPDYD